MTSENKHDNGNDDRVNGNSGMMIMIAMMTPDNSGDEEVDDDAGVNECK